ncbi:MAG: T9SS type A sorting domain-containing protein [Bacteroidota bacterium]
MKKNIDAKVFDIYGRKVFESEIKNPKSAIKIILNKYSSGIYILELNGENIFYKTKLVKQ